MADLKISQLTPSTSAASGDQLIINKGDATTQKIDVSDFVQSLIGGGGDGGTDGLPDLAISPSFFTFGVSYTGDAADFERVTGIDSVFEPQPSVKMTMPPGTDRAMVVNSYGSSIFASPLIQAGGDTNGMAQFQYSVTLTNATWRFAPAGQNAMMAMGSAYHMPALYNYGVADSYGCKGDHSRPNIIEFTPGSEVTFTLKVGIRRAKKCIPGVGGGRMMVFPYNSSNEITAQTFEAFAAGSLMDDGVKYAAAGGDPDIFDPLTPAEIDQQNSQDFKNETRYFISRITDALEYDEQLDITYPPNVNVEDITGGPDAPVRTVLDNIRKAIFNLKYDPTTDVTVLSGKLKRLVYGDENAGTNGIPGAAGYIEFKYNFETNNTGFSL